MKKLIIAATIVVAATVGQAAVVTWSGSSTKFVDNETGVAQTSIASGSIMLVLLSDTKGWSEGTWSASAGSLTELASASIGTGKSKGKINGTSYSFAYDEDNVSASPLKDGDVLAVVFKDSSGAYDQLEYYSSKSAVTDTLTVSGLASAGNTWSQEFLFGQGTASAGGIYAPSTSSIPEPTSAMLLVLGMAGLMLKRKRA